MHPDRSFAQDLATREGACGARLCELQQRPNCRTIQFVSVALWLATLLRGRTSAWQADPRSDGRQSRGAALSHRDWHGMAVVAGDKIAENPCKLEKIKVNQGI